MFVLHFGPDFDGPVYTAKRSELRAGEVFAGPKKLLQWLEGQLGRSGYPDNTEYLRIELYRQALGQHLQETEQEPLFSDRPFYERSYQADRFATAAVLLDWRDELLLAGWDLVATEAAMPPRLRTIAATEAIFRKKTSDPETVVLAAGFADRFEAVLAQLKKQSVPLSKIYLYEPLPAQPAYMQRLVQLLEAGGVVREQVEVSCAAPEHTRLGRLQRRLATGVALKGSDTGDESNSLLILLARRDSDAAVYVAQMLKENPALQPVFLVPEMNLSLERALHLQGFPTMGVLSASLARPSLQVLKLAPAFLWEPVDVFKIMEFVTLPVKPLDGSLALEIARVMAGKPGLFSDTWFAAVFGYLEQAEVPDKAREQYDFWFGRRRYPANGTAPKRDAIALYAYLHQWALDHFEESDNSNTSLLVLAEQARRIRELLEALPEQRISFLELERIVRTIYSPSPVQLAPAEVGRFSYIHNPGAMTEPAETLLWWNCLFDNPVPAPDKWLKDERVWLENLEVLPTTPAQESHCRQIRQIRPVLQASRQLILVVPEQAEGAGVVPSLLLGDIEAAFPDYRDFTYNLDDESDRNRFNRIFSLKPPELLEVSPPGRTRPHLQIVRPELLADSAYETPTNLESLFYYPHRWFFRQKLRLFPSGLLSVTGDNTLLGSLAHRFFEQLLKEDLGALDRRAVQQWVDEKSVDLLPREGATMLLYGREPERNAFLNRVKNAAWSLISLIRSNGWEVAHTELELQGAFSGIPVRGKADLVLQRGDERAIVDLKWSGANRRKELIRNGEDLQLVLYAKLLPPPDQWPHTAYFILEEGKMIARNAVAFRESIIAGRGDDDHAGACTAIFSRMEKTFAWRMEQIHKGKLELRTARTAPELEALYGEELFDLLEMKSEDARWDDYRTLLGEI
jgi:hypothetical protein